MSEDSYTVKFSEGMLTILRSDGVTLGPGATRGLALDILKAQDYEVVPAKDLEDALEKLKISKEYVTHLKAQVEALQNSVNELEIQASKQIDRLQVVHDKLDKANHRVSELVCRLQTADKRLAIVREVIDL